MLNLNIAELKEVLTDFFNLTHMLIVVFDADHKVVLTYPNSMCGFCGEIRSNGRLQTKCYESDSLGFRMCEEKKGVVIYTCHMGLTEAVAPIYSGGILIGYLMLGQLLLEENREKCAEMIRHAASEYGVDAERLEKMLGEMAVVDMPLLKSAVNIMQICACYLWMKQILNVNTDSLAYNIDKYITEHLADEIRVGDICAVFGISKSSLYKLSKEEFKMGVSEYVKLRRLQTAGDLIKTSVKPLCDIAETVGIRDPSYFTKLFKAYSGITPNCWRKKYSSDK